MFKSKIIFLFVVSLMLVGCGNREDMMDYIDVEFSGIDTRGTAEYIFDEDSFLESLYGTSNFDELDMEQQDELYDAGEASEITLDNDSNLENGDTVTVTVEVDEDRTEILSGGSEQEFEVEGLSEGTTVDAAYFEDNVSASFDGVDGSGVVQEINQSFDEDFPEVSFDVENDGELSNGESAVFTVDDNSFNRLSQSDYILSEDDRSFEIEVGGLREPTVITNEELSENVVVTFSGASGRGSADHIETTFSSDVPSFEVEVENNGELSNGDNVEVSVTDESLEQLERQEYVIEDGSESFEVEVNGLTGYAATMSEINNLEDVKRLIQEEADSSYEDSNPDQNYGHSFEVTFHEYYYRQFEEESQNTELSYIDLTSDDGNLYGVFHVERYSGGDEPELEDEYYVARGFNNIELDEDQNANISSLSNNTVRFDDSYSLDTVRQLITGFGYVAEDDEDSESEENNEDEDEDDSDEDTDETEDEESEE